MKVYNNHQQINKDATTIIYNKIINGLIENSYK